MLVGSVENGSGEVNYCGVYRHRSLMGFRVLSPYNHWASAWSIFVTLVDATYIAFVVPILLAFSFGLPRAHGFRNWISLLEICTGKLLFVGKIACVAMSEWFMCCSEFCICTSRSVYCVGWNSGVEHRSIHEEQLFARTGVDLLCGTV